MVCFCTFVISVLWCMLRMLCILHIRYVVDCVFVYCGDVGDCVCSELFRMACVLCILY